MFQDPTNGKAKMVNLFMVNEPIGDRFLGCQRQKTASQNVANCKKLQEVAPSVIQEQ